MKKNYNFRKRLQGKGKHVLLFTLFFTILFSAQAQDLVWEENFNGTTINPDTWTFDFGDGCERGICGWGNQELEYYTSRPENARIEDGSLLIEAKREDFLGKPFTSARLKTYGRVQFKYGTLEARIKVSDLENGLWPAFWMLGTTGNWPASGEIDILEMGSAEAIANNVINKQVGAAVHWEHSEGHATHHTKHISDTDLSNEYHIYKMVWNKDFIRMYIDNIEYFAINISGAAASDLEEFHQSHYILLNLAVGGTYTGIPTAAGVTAPMPGKMYVDYIKLYQDPADDGELYLGKDNAYAGNFGIYTETTPVSGELKYEENANLYIWNNLSEIPGAAAYEGSEVLALSAASGQWFGFGVDNKPVNLLNFAEEGNLNFHLKTTYAGQFKVGVKSGHGESWINFGAGQNLYGLRRDGEWHQVSIPLSAFNNPDMGMHIDLGSMSQTFMFAGDAAAGNAEFYFDNIYYGGGVSENPRPTVAITSPANEALFPAHDNITIEATAADENGSVAKVDFYQGNFLLGTDETSPYSLNWENVPAGVYQLTARATDDGGAVAGSAAVEIFVSPTDNTAPIVNITAPEMDVWFVTPATITITADAQDTEGSIYKVEFYYGETLLGTDVNSPYSFDWRNVTAGTYSITAKVTDSGKLSTTSEPVTVVVEDNAVVSDKFGVYSEDPSITSRLRFGQDAELYVWNGLTPISGATPLEGAEVLAFNATPGNWFGFGIDNNLKNISHFADGSLKFSMKTSYSGSFSIGIKTGSGDNFIAFDAGIEKYGLIRDGKWHEVSIPFRDFDHPELTSLDQAFMFVGDAPAGATAFHFDNIYYSTEAVNSEPVVAITAPAANAVLNIPANITIEATATDHDGTVAKVEFYNGETLLGTDESSPYSFTWNEVASGNYTLTAKAYDNEGAMTISAPVEITVKDPAAGGPNLALNQPVVVSSEENAGSPGTAAVDGNTGTRWSSAFSDPQWIYVDLGAAYDIDRVNITWEGAYAKAYAIQVSSDAETWEDIKTVSGNSGLENDHTGLSGTGRYLRIFGTERATPYGYSIFELEVYGNEASGAGNYCATAENGDYSFKAETGGGEVTYTFHPEEPIAGTNMAIIYIREEAEGAYPGYGMTRNADGDFTFSKTIPPGTVTSVYFTYALPEGGERNSAASPHTYTVGDVCGDNPVDPEEPTEPGAFCGTAENGDYSFRAETGAAEVTFTFHPEEPIAGSNMAIIYIREGTEGAYPGYGMVKNEDGDFTFSKSIPAGTEISIYFTYAVPSGGERNSAANPHTYVVGDVCGDQPANTPPTVVLSSPSDEAVLDGPADILLEAMAGDAEGNVVKVEFYEGTNLLNTDDSSPFSFTWNKVSGGSYTFTAVAYDEEGLSTTSKAVNVTVQCVTTFYADADGDGFGNADETQTACEIPAGYVAIAGDCNDSDANINPDASDLCDGTDRNCDDIVRSPMEVPVIKVTPGSNVYTGGDNTTIFLGYGAQNVTLQAEANEAVAYSWTSADGTVTGTEESLLFVPETAGLYKLTLTATNASDCSADAGLTIQVIDVRCGNKMDKVMICHKGKDICVAPSAVQAHLAHGDQLGSCKEADEVATTGKDRFSLNDQSNLVAYPNPSEGLVKIKISMKQKGNYTLSLHDINGALVKKVAEGQSKKGVSSNYELDGSALPAGMYLIRLRTGKEVTVKSLIIQH